MKKVLIVEDDKKVAALLQQYIGELDGSVECALFAKAAEAYRYAMEEAVRLFILERIRAVMPLFRCDMVD
ncbi:MAG: hypothetical protein LBI03_02085 [Clostridiales bacterium]|nr:hypothetical protein [Clostridiales bacterium]